MKIKFLTLLSILFSQFCLSSGFYLPDANIPSGYDRVRTSDGTSCETSISPDSYFEMGLYGNKLENDNWYNNNKHNYSNNGNDETGIYARFIMPIGGPKKRINCNNLYDLEVERLKFELLQLKKDLNNKHLEDLIWPKNKIDKSKIKKVSKTSSKTSSNHNLLPVTEGTYIFKPK